MTGARASLHTHASPAILFTDSIESVHAMAIYEAERNATRFKRAVVEDTTTIGLRQQGVDVHVMVRSAILACLEADLARGRIDPSRQEFAESLADDIATALERDGDVATVAVDGPKELYDLMWDHLMKLAVRAERIDERVIYSEISHGAVPERGCLFTRVFTFPH